MKDTAMSEDLSLVTGASGFIGTALCESLRRSGRVRALLRRRVSGPWDQAVYADLETEEIPAGAMEGVGTVFHLAAKTHALAERAGDEQGYERINVTGTGKVLDACRGAGVRRLVFFSSVKAMGEGGPGRQDETAEPRPTTPYGRSKRTAELMVLRRGDVPEPVVLRLCMVYGPGGKGNLSRMIEAVDRGVFPPVPEFGNRRSMVHVDDVVEAAKKAAASGLAPGRVFIVSDGRTYSTREMYLWICEALGRRVPKRSIPPAAFKVLAKVGDAIGRVKGARWKFDSDAYDKLVGSAQYDDATTREILGFFPKRDLRSAMPGIVAALRGGDRKASLLS